jgi:hypothetical protein
VPRLLGPIRNYQADKGFIGAAHKNMNRRDGESLRFAGVQKTRGSAGLAEALGGLVGEDLAVADMDDAMGVLGDVRLVGD